VTSHDNYRALLLNPIIEGDNLLVMRQLISDGLAMTHAPELVYMDPPFNTGIVQKGGMGFGGSDRLSYNDPTCDLMLFADELTLRAKVAWSMLPMQGSLVIHLDWRAVHYAKVHLDHCLGVKNFASEIIWRYRRWPAKTRNFQRMHDTLLRYVKSPGDHTWNQLYEPLADSTMRAFGTGKQRAVFVESGRKTGKRQGLLRLKSEATAELSPGVPMSDVWDIGIVPPSGNERTGYPTQKPEALLERLILATPLANAYAPGQLVSFMDVARLDQDTIEIQHHTDSDGVCEISGAFRTFRDGRDPSGTIDHPIPTAEMSLTPCGTPITSFAGLSWQLPCAPGSYYAPAGCGCDSGATSSYEVGGNPSTVYDVDLRVRGVVEMNSYSGGTVYTPTYVYKNATGGLTNVNRYKLIVSDPPATYYLNRGSFSEYDITTLDYNVTVPIRGGATISLVADSIDTA